MRGNLKFLFSTLSIFLLLVSFAEAGKKKDDKDKKLHAIGDEMMCRIASLLPNNRQGPFSGHHKIKTYQRENGIVPSPQPFFKEMPEE